MVLPRRTFDRGKGEPSPPVSVSCVSFGCANLSEGQGHAVRSGDVHDYEERPKETCTCEASENRRILFNERLHVLRGKDPEHVDQGSSPKRITAIALSCSEQSICLRQLNGTDVISLRTGGRCRVPCSPGATPGRRVDQAMDLERNRLFGRPYSTRVDRCAGGCTRPSTS